MSLKFRVQLWLATHFGFYRYDGLRGHQPPHMPVAYLRYPSGDYSCAMALGNAVDYARMFGGEVLSPEEYESIMAVRKFMEAYRG